MGLQAMSTRDMGPILNSLMMATLDHATTSRPALRNRFKEILQDQLRDPAQDAAASIPDDVVITGARAIAEAHGSNPDDPAPLTVMCTEDNAPVPWWMVYVEDAEACLGATSSRSPAASGSLIASDIAEQRDAVREHVRKLEQENAQLRAQVETARAKAIEECKACIPTSWLDPLLSGPGSFGKLLPLSGQHVEDLMRALHIRISQKVSSTKSEGK
jgi:hypothetical protein